MTINAQQLATQIITAWVQREHVTVERLAGWLDVTTAEAQARLDGTLEWTLDDILNIEALHHFTNSGIRPPLDIFAGLDNLAYLTATQYEREMEAEADRLDAEEKEAAL